MGVCATNYYTNHPNLSDAPYSSVDAAELWCSGSSRMARQRAMEAWLVAGSPTPASMPGCGLNQEESLWEFLSQPGPADAEDQRKWEKDDRCDDGFGWKVPTGSGDPLGICRICGIVPSWKFW